MSLPEDVVVIDTVAPPAVLYNMAQYTAAWREAYEWWLLCGGTRETWLEQHEDRREWIDAVLKLWRFA